MAESKPKEGVTRAARGAQRAREVRERDARRHQDRRASALARPALRSLGDASNTGQPLGLTSEQRILKSRADALAPALINHALAGVPVTREVEESAKDPALRSLLIQRVKEAAAAIAIADGGPVEKVTALAAERVNAWAEQTAGGNADEGVA